jgi:hypothetical protein
MVHKLVAEHACNQSPHLLAATTLAHRKRGQEAAID